MFKDKIIKQIIDENQFFQLSNHILQRHHQSIENQVTTKSAKSKMPLKVKSKFKISVFLKTLSHILNTQQSHINWNEDEKSFKIINTATFTEELLPKYFKHSNLSSFIRQLNIYDFKKVCDQKYPLSYIYMHPYFQKQNPELMYNIRRKVRATEERSLEQSQIIIKSQEFDQLDAFDQKKSIEYLQHKLFQIISQNKNIENQNQKLQEQLCSQKDKNAEILTTAYSLLSGAYVAQYIQFASHIDHRLKQQQLMINSLQVYSKYQKSNKSSKSDENSKDNENSKSNEYQKSVSLKNFNGYTVSGKSNSNSTNNQSCFSGDQQNKNSFSIISNLVNSKLNGSSYPPKQARKLTEDQRSYYNALNSTKYGQQKYFSDKLYTKVNINKNVNNQIQQVLLNTKQYSFDKQKNSRIELMAKVEEKSNYEQQFLENISSRCVIDLNKISSYKLTMNINNQQ